MNKLYRAPCKDCEFRKPACHDRCPAYLDYKSKMQSIRKRTEVEEAISEGKSRFWDDVRKRGLKI